MDRTGWLDRPLNRNIPETVLKQHIPVERRSIEYAAWGVVLLVLVQLCWLQWPPDSDLRRICSLAMKPANSGETVTPEEQWQWIASPAGSGNGLLKLAGYTKTNLAAATHLAYFYNLTSYTLYPRRVYVATTDTIINNGRDIIRAGFNPNEAWLQQHDIRYVLTFGNEQAGGKTPRLEILPPRDDQAAAQTNRSGGK
jgi:hypothetical protein